MAKKLPVTFETGDDFSVCIADTEVAVCANRSGARTVAEAFKNFFLSIDQDCDITLVLNRSREAGHVLESWQIRNKN